MHTFKNWLLKIIVGYYSYFSSVSAAKIDNSRIYIMYYFSNL